MNVLEKKYLVLLRQCKSTSYGTTPSKAEDTTTTSGSSTIHQLQAEWDQIIIPNAAENDMEKEKNTCKTINELRRLVLLEGMPPGANDLNSKPFGRCSLRGLVWKALLGIGTVDVQEYADIVRRGPSADDSRLREDTRRTFSKNDDFVNKVPNEKLIRVLNAYVHSAGNIRGVYAQSMSLLLAPFLYVMPEPDAFHCFRVYLRVKIPEYVRKYSGAKRGCELLDTCLRATNRSLYDLFMSRGLNAEVYAFPNISSLGACVPPISDTVRLWDIQLAFGVHMHVLFTLSRLLLASERILKESANDTAAPLITRELERGLGVNADTVLEKAIPLVLKLHPQLYWQLTRHAVSPSTEDVKDNSPGSDPDLSELVVNGDKAEAINGIQETEDRMPSCPSSDDVRALQNESHAKPVIDNESLVADEYSSDTKPFSETPSKRLSVQEDTR